jgi:hypothetical protein
MSQHIQPTAEMPRSFFLGAKWRTAKVAWASIIDFLHDNTKSCTVSNYNHKMALFQRNNVKMAVTQTILNGGEKNLRSKQRVHITKEDAENTLKDVKEEK